MKTLFTEEEFAELNANAETYKRLYEYLSSANLKIKSYIYEVKLNTDHLYFAEGETEEGVGLARKDKRKIVTALQRLRGT
jgi:hypothetical protein